MNIVKTANVYRYKLFGITILKVIHTQYYSRFAFLKIFKIYRYKYRKSSYKEYLNFIKNTKNSLLYFDHSCGGGTAIYTERKLKELDENYYIIICKYDRLLKKYICAHNNTCFVTKSITKVVSDLFQYIIVNNLVGYPDPEGVLKALTTLKTKKTDVNIDVMIHDYYCMCQRIHLLREDSKLCLHNCKLYCTGCEDSHNAISAKQWRELWKQFLEQVADNVIVFSNSSKSILLSVYPDLENKIFIIPHKCPSLRKVIIKPHDCINIGVFGRLNEIKGKKIIEQIAKMLPSNVNIICIGEYLDIKKQTPNFIHTGMYDLEDLPDVVEKHKIDVAFISSIVPETYSFTTSECMAMGLPVVCFNLGAQAERIAKYKKGLVLGDISPKENLYSIIEFVNNLKK